MCIRDRGYTIPGFDRGTRWVSRTVTLARADGRWRIQSWRGPADRWEPFDLPDLQVVRTERSLVAGPVSLDVLRARLADVELGQNQVAAVLGRWVPAVVIVSATAEQSGRLLGAALAPSLSAGPGQAVSDGQLAATTHGDRAPASPALADRVILDPVGLAQLTAAGRRVVLTHELTHVAVRASTLHDVPLWLSAGFAEWVAFRAERLDPRVVAARPVSYTHLDVYKRQSPRVALAAPAPPTGQVHSPSRSTIRTPGLSSHRSTSSVSSAYAAGAGPKGAGTASAVARRLSM